MRYVIQHLNGMRNPAAILTKLRSRTGWFSGNTLWLNESETNFKLSSNYENTSKIIVNMNYIDTGMECVNLSYSVLVFRYRNIKKYYVIQVINNTNTTVEYRLCCHF